MPTLEFSTISTPLLRPVLAKDYVPDWWKRSKGTECKGGALSDTLRMCPAMDDLLKIGWYYVINYDVEIQCNDHEYGPNRSRKWKSVTPYQYNNSASHPHIQQTWDQCNHSHHRKTTDSFKFVSDWGVKTPIGYSCLYIDPFLHNNENFTLWPGVIDTDKFSSNTDNAPMIFLPKIDKSFIIKKGTPVAQLIPFKREEWVGSFLYHKKRNFAENACNDIDPNPEDLIRYEYVGDVESGRHKIDIAQQNNGRGKGYRTNGLWEPKTKFFSNAIKYDTETYHQLELDL